MGSEEIGMANLNDSLNKLSELSSSGEVARVSRPKRNAAKKQTESAKNLLGSLLDDSVATAEMERVRDEEAKKRAEEEAQRKKEYDEEMAKLEAEQAILAEQNEIEERKARQAEMQAQLQREKDIEAGIIDLEEEARQKREAEEREAAIAAEKAKKEADKRAAEALRISQQNELEALHNEEINAVAAPKKQNFGIIGVVIVLILVVGGAAGFFLKEKSDNAFDYYGLNSEYHTQTIRFVALDTSVVGANFSIVKQEAPPKPVKKAPAKKKPAQTVAPKPKPSLSGGKGGLFGNRKL